MVFDRVYSIDVIRDLSIRSYNYSIIKASNMSKTTNEECNFYDLFGYFIQIVLGVLSFGVLIS